jgi:hypothetical protein
MKAIAWLVGTVLIATLSLLPTPAHAFCTQGGSIVSIFAAPDTALSSIFLRNSGQVSTFVWVAFTSDDKMLAAALSALQGQTRVAMTGDAVSCPTAGETRQMGEALVISLNP